MSGVVIGNGFHHTAYSYVGFHHPKYGVYFLMLFQALLWFCFTVWLCMDGQSYIRH